MFYILTEKKSWNYVQINFGVQILGEAAVFFNTDISRF